MSICPFATYRPISVNHGGAMTGHLGLVVHVQQGNGSLYGFFSNPASQVSAHFWCSKTGQLEQYLDTDVVAWAEANGNDSYASCEFEGFDTEAMTPAQIVTGRRLAAWLSNLEGWPLAGPVAHGAKGVTAHCNLDGSPDPLWGNHPCPGHIRLSQITELVAAAPAPQQPSGEDMPVGPAISFRVNQTDVLQISSGTLWHKFKIGGGSWINEGIAGPSGGVSGVTVNLVGGLEVVVLGGQCIVTCEDNGAKAWYFAQGQTGGWGAAQLP